MPERSGRYRTPRDLGAESPGSEESKEQGASGARGGPREWRPAPTVPKQPPQESGRRSARHQQPPTARKHFDPAEAPSAQGTGEPGAETLKRRQQGLRARSGSTSAHGVRTEEEAERGEPAAGHTRHGRHHVPGRGERAGGAG